MLPCVLCTGAFTRVNVALLVCCLVYCVLVHSPGLMWLYFCAALCTGAFARVKWLYLYAALCTVSLWAVVPQWPSGKASVLSAADPGTVPHFSWSSHNSDSTCSLLADCFPLQLYQEDLYRLLKKNKQKKTKKSMQPWNLVTACML